MTRAVLSAALVAVLGSTLWIVAFAVGNLVADVRAVRRRRRWDRHVAEALAMSAHLSARPPVEDSPEWAQAWGLPE